MRHLVSHLDFIVRNPSRQVEAIMKRRSFLKAPAALVLPGCALAETKSHINAFRDSGRSESFFSWTSRQLLTLYLEERLDVRSRVSVILGHAMTGKTALLCGLINNASYVAGAPSMYISASEDARRVQDLLCHARTRFDPGLASSGLLSPAEYAEFRTHVKQPAKLGPMFVDFSARRGPYGKGSESSTLSDLERNACILRDYIEGATPATGQPALLVVDDAQFLGSPDFVWQILHHLFRFSSEFNIVVVLTVRSLEEAVCLDPLEQIQATAGLTEFLDRADHVVALSRPNVFQDEPAAPSLSATVLDTKTDQRTVRDYYWA